MTSDTEICNSALTKIGERSITSITDSTKQARTCNLRYDPCRLAILRAYNWNFAIKRVILAPLTTTPAFRFENEFALPSDFIRIIDVDLGRNAFKIEDNKILINADSVELIYSADVTDESKFDPLFSETLAAYLAWDISLVITDSQSIKNEMWKTYRRLLAEAKFTNSVEEEPIISRADTFISARTRFNQGFVRDPGT